MNFSLLRTLLAACAIVAVAATLSYSQTARIQNQIMSERNAPPTAGRDFWFGIPSNSGGNGVYLRLYITSSDSTTAYVSLGTGNRQSVPIAPYKLSTFDISQTWELQSSADSGQAVHVWSNNHNLTVYYMNHAFATSDGTYLIPTIGWGTDYVVAGYASLYEGNADYPSEFTIAADENNTTVQITPSCDIRQGSSPTAVAYQAGHTYNLTFQRGEAMQFLSVQAQNVTGYDVTGTIIHSNHPIGVIAGSMCTNIPVNFPYCDHVEHMLPPVRTWGDKYYATSFIQPPNKTGHDFGLYLMVASKDSQTIYRSDYATGTHVECSLMKKYDVYWDELETAQKFWSDAPFMLVEYINSASYPDNSSGAGDPAEVVIPAVSQFARTAFVEAAPSAGSQTSYDNYANIILRISDEHKTTFDGQSILTYTRQPIDDTFEIFTIPHLKPGVSVVGRDSGGVGVYVYGYGTDESYAWSGALGLSTFNSPDTLAPKATITGACYQSFVHLADSGYLPKTSVVQSGITSIQFDSSYNMIYALDSNWVEGAGADTSGYSLTVTDPSKPAFLSMEVFDQAGNRTQIVSTYVPQTASIEPPIQIFGKVISPATKTEYDTLVNTGTRTYRFNSVSLLHGNLGFTLDSGMAPDTLRVGERRAIKIRFQAVTSATVIDSLILEDDCGRQSAALIGNGGVADFLVTDQQWLNESLPAPPNGYVKAVTIENLSSIPITIDSVWWADTVHFKAVSSLPVTLSALGTVPFSIAYFPDDSSAIVGNRTQGNWQSLGNAVRTDSLVGSAQAPMGVESPEPESDALVIANNPFSNELRIHLSGLGTPASSLVVLDVLGRTVTNIPNRNPSGNGDYRVDTRSWPAGVYFIRLQTGDNTLTKRIVKAQ